MSTYLAFGLWEQQMVQQIFLTYGQNTEHHVSKRAKSNNKKLPRNSSINYLCKILGKINYLCKIQICTTLIGAVSEYNSTISNSASAL